jgi:ATP-dependent Lon protease
LDEDHFGLEKPKEKIIEHIAVQILKHMKGLFVCRTSRSKTSLGKSIARHLAETLLE